MTVQVNLEQLDRALEEQGFWMQVLALWAHAEEALGRELREQVSTFTFRDEFLNTAMRGANDLARKQHKPRPFSGATHHNCVRLKDESLQEIPIIPRPEMPEWMAVDLKVKV